MKQKQLEVTVLGTDGIKLSKCTKKRAHQLISREAADWVGYNVLKLRYTRQDRKRFREEALKRDNYTCYICGKVMHPDHPELTGDHIRSRTKGGTDYPDNIACCCEPCNEEKGHMDLESFLAMRRKEGKVLNDQ